MHWPSGIASCGGPNRGASEGEGPQRRLDRRLEEVAKVIGGGYCRLQMPLSLALAVRGTVAGRRLGALEGGASLGLIAVSCAVSGPVSNCRSLGSGCS